MITENSLSLFTKWEFQEAEPLDLNQSLNIRDGLVLETGVWPDPMVQFIHAKSRNHGQNFISNN